MVRNPAQPNPSLVRVQVTLSAGFEGPQSSTPLLIFACLWLPLFPWDEVKLGAARGCEGPVGGGGGGGGCNPERAVNFPCGFAFAFCRRWRLPRCPLADLFCVPVLGQCPEWAGKCKHGRELLRHIESCNKNDCSIPQCLASKRLLKHHHGCKVRLPDRPDGGPSCAQLS